MEIGGALPCSYVPFTVFCPESEYWPNVHQCRIRTDGMRFLREVKECTTGDKLKRKQENKNKPTPSPWSASEIYRPRDRRLSAKLVPTFVDREYRVDSETDPHGRNLAFPDWSRCYFFPVAPQLYSRGWVDSVPDPLLLRKSGSAGNQTRDLWICNQELWPLDHRGGLLSST
jgi:hypothetical protein